MANETLASLLREMAFFAELKGENPFKIRAWQNSAGILEELPEAAALVKSGEITSTPGIGKGTQALVKEFVETGRLGEHAALKAAFPPRLLELLEVRGLGPKKVKALYEQIQVASLAELEYACQENRLVELKGFGAKTQESVLKNIQKLKSQKGKAILPMARQEAETVREELAAMEGVEEVAETGELRRLLPVIGSLDFVLGGEVETIEASLRDRGFAREDGRWLKKSDERLLVRVWPVAVGSFGTRLLETTGPESFVTALADLPNKRREAEVFAAKGVEALAPEARDLGHGKDLVEAADIKGVFHLHTNWSDGKNSLEEMAAAAVDLGYEYLGVSEHSQTAFYAHGLDGKRVEQQRREIDKVQEKFPSLRIFQGIESDILGDGSLDFPDETLKLFDFVIASVHGQMRMSRDDMTKRLCRVLEHPATTWLGHWTGRLLLGRDGFDFDQEKVLAAAARSGKGIELNSNPYRLDMDWSLLPAATALGIPIGIFPDAHSVHGLADIQYGVWMARKGGLTRAQVVNTKGRREMEAWLDERRFR